MRVVTSIIQDTLAQSAEVAAAAESSGYDCVTTQENNHDPFLPLAVAATNTRRVELTTGIALAFPRSPTIMASTAWDLHVSSAGRLSLGIGSQVKGHNERRFSVPWSAPQPRLKEYIQAMRAVWDCWEHGTDLKFEGEHYNLSLMPPNFRPPVSNLKPIPVTIAALGPAMLRLSGEQCDGVRLHPFNTRRYIENVVMKEVETGRNRGGVSREQFEVSGGGFLATGKDEQAVQKGIEWVRWRIAFYGSTRTYHGVFEQHDLLDLGLKLHEMSKKGQWDDMPTEVSDDVIELFAAIGTFDDIAQRVAERYGGLVDTLSDDTVFYADPADRGLPTEVIAKIREASTPFQGFRTDWNHA